MSTDDRTPLTTSEALCWRRGAEAARQADIADVQERADTWYPDYADRVAVVSALRGAARGLRALPLPEPPEAEPQEAACDHGTHRHHGDTPDCGCPGCPLCGVHAHDARIRRAAIEECAAKLREMEAAARDDAEEYRDTLDAAARVLETLR